MPREGYHDPSYVKSRHKAINELKELAENAPKPQTSWQIIWVLSGPEVDFEGKSVKDEMTVPGYNQTKQRLETGMELVKQITALRLNKKPGEVTPEDIKQTGPKIYYNGTQEHNDFCRELALPGGLMQTAYNFPGENVIITANNKITNTNDQFDDLPANLAGNNQQIVLISDLYHLPRVKRYAKKNKDKFLKNQLVFYPSLPLKLPVGKTLRDIRNIHPYIKAGFLPPDED